jgi:hypothetical protein
VENRLKPGSNKDKNARELEATRPWLAVLNAFPTLFGNLELKMSPITMRDANSRQLSSSFVQDFRNVLVLMVELITLLTTNTCYISFRIEMADR